LIAVLKTVVMTNYYKVVRCLDIKH